MGILALRQRRRAAAALAPLQWRRRPAGMARDASPAAEKRSRRPAATGKGEREI